MLLARAQYVLRTIIDGGAFDTMDAVQQEFNHRLRMWSDSDERAAFDDGISARGAVPEHWYDWHPELRLMRLISKEGAQALQPYLRDGITTVVFDRDIYNEYPGDGDWGQPASDFRSSSGSGSDSDELADTDTELIVFAVSAQVENTRLRAEIEQLRAENQQLRNENAQLLQLPTPPSVSPSGASDASQAMAGLNIGDVYFGASR